MPIHELVILAIVLIFSSMVQGITGFGISLVAFPLLALFISPSIIVPTLVLVSVIINIMVFRSARGAVNFREIRVMLLFAVIATPFGAYLIKTLSSDALSIVAGILISGTSLMLMSGKHVSFRNENFAKSITGFLSGTLNGSLSMSGPPIILFMSNEGKNKNEIRGNFSLYSMLINICTVVSYFFADMLTMDVMQSFAFALPAILLGTALGIRISGKVNEKLFKRIVLIFLLLMGINTLAFAILG